MATKKVTENKGNQEPKVRKTKADKWLTEEGLSQIEVFASEGCIEADVAHKMGISARTLTTWKDIYPQILLALKRGNNNIDGKVENALLENCLKGNVTAQIFWLCNRKPNEWKRNRVETVITDTETGVIEIPAVEVADAK